jgi:zinc transporter, ZIP family
LERVLILHSCAEDDCSNDAHRRFGRMGALGLIAHSTLDGAAIGAATLVSWREGVIVAIAIVAHNSSDGLNTMMLVTRGERAHQGDFVFLGLDAVAPVLGAVLALQFLPSEKWLAVFLALASGFFLYTATSDLLPEAHRQCLHHCKKRRNAGPANRFLASATALPLPYFLLMNCIDFPLTLPF